MTPENDREEKVPSAAKQSEGSSVSETPPSEEKSESTTPPKKKRSRSRRRKKAAAGSEDLSRSGETNPEQKQAAQPEKTEHVDDLLKVKHSIPPAQSAGETPPTQQPSTDQDSAPAKDSGQPPKPANEDMGLLRVHRRQ